MLQKLLNTRQIEFVKILMLPAILGSTLLAFYTLHDIQIAQGAGLYLSLVFHQDSRILFDLIVDIMGILLFFFAILFPTLFSKSQNYQSFFRLFSVYLAFMPVVNPGNVVHLPEAFTNFTFRESLRSGNWGHFFFIELAPAFHICTLLLPFLILLFALVKNLPNRPKVSPLYLLLSLGAFIVFCIFDNVADTFYFFSCYFLILLCFQLWETLCLASPKFAMWSNILFYGCLFRGIYRMLELIRSV